MLAEISAKLFAEWMAYFRIEPFGQLRGDLQAGIVAAQVFNAWRDRHQKPAGPNDYELKFGEDERPRKQTPAEMRKVLESLCGVVHHKDVHHKEPK